MNDRIDFLTCMNRIRCIPSFVRIEWVRSASIALYDGLDSSGSLKESPFCDHTMQACVIILCTMVEDGEFTACKISGQTHSQYAAMISFDLSVCQIFGDRVSSLKQI